MRLDNQRGRLRVNRKRDDFSPMEGVGNMADAMLVFACGILLALIMSWNIDVSDRGEITKSPENLEEMGKVYKDPETGKYYVVEE